MHERAFAASARSANGNELVSGDLQGNTIQGVHGPVASLIIACDIPKRDQESFIPHGERSRKPGKRFQHHRRGRRFSRGGETPFSARAPDKTRWASDTLVRTEEVVCLRNCE